MIRPRVQPIPALTGIRLLAALGVVVGHFSVIMYGLFPYIRGVDSLLQGGYLGVEVFFLLSGFIISHNYAERFRTWSARVYGTFLRNRLARLYPVHLFTLAVVAVLMVVASVAKINLTSGGKYDVLSFLMNVSMLQSVPPAWSWNGPAWSISTEAGAYLAFPVLALLLAKVRNWKVAALAVVLLLSATVGGLYAVSLGTDFSGMSYPSMWIRIAGEFAAGCFLWKIWSITGAKGIIYDFLAILSLVGIGGMLFMTPVNTWSTFLVLPLIALFVFSCGAASGPVRRLLSARFMDYGGRISYSLYMVHVIVLMVGGKLLPWESFVESHWLVRLAVFGSYFAASFVAAALIYRFVEEPWRERIGRLGRAKTVPLGSTAEQPVVSRKA